MTDDTPDGSVKLGVKKTVPSGGSTKKKAVISGFCHCDTEYKYLDSVRLTTVLPFLEHSRHLELRGWNSYMAWMSLCARRLPEKVYFVNWAYYGRWWFQCNTGSDIVNGVLTIQDLQVSPRSVLDFVVYPTDDRHIPSAALAPLGYTSSSVTVLLPFLRSGEHIFLDVYWQYNPCGGID